MGWQPPPRGARGAQEAPPGSSRRGLADRVGGFLILATLIAVTLPGLWIALWSLSDEEPCSESASIVEETRPSKAPENALFAMLPDHPRDWPLTIDAPTDLSFAAQGHGSTPGAEQDWRDALLLHGFRGGRLLTRGESAGAHRPAIWAHTNEFATSGDALSFHRWGCRVELSVHGGRVRGLWAARSGRHALRLGRRAHVRTGLVRPGRPSCGRGSERR
jgi:hypothetical protein